MGKKTYYKAPYEIQLRERYNVTPSGCWEWTGAKTKAQYGQVEVDGVTQYAHRMAFLLANGTLPALVRHECDNPPCINPAHLLGGDQKDNMQDALKRGRHFNLSIRNQGENHSRAKFTNDQAMEIISAYNSDRETIDELAARFATSRNRIYHIATGLTHKSLRAIYGKVNPLKAVRRYANRHID